MSACMLWHTCECQRQFVAAGLAPLFTKLNCQPRNPTLDGLIWAAKMLPSQEKRLAQLMLNRESTFQVSYLSTPMVAMCGHKTNANSQWVTISKGVWKSEFVGRNHLISKIWNLKNLKFDNQSKHKKQQLYRKIHRSKTFKKSKTCNSCPSWLV